MVIPVEEWVLFSTDVLLVDFWVCLLDPVFFLPVLSSLFLTLKEPISSRLVQVIDFHNATIAFPK